MNYSIMRNAVGRILIPYKEFLAWNSMPRITWLMTIRKGSNSQLLQYHTPTSCLAVCGLSRPQHTKGLGSGGARLSTSCVALKERSTGGLPGVTKMKKDDADNSPMIILIDTNDKVSVVSLTQAHRFAKRKDLKVVKVEDRSVKMTGKEVYKLLTGKQYFQEDIKAKRESKATSGTKGEKVMNLTSKISPHDLKIKLSNISKWLSKGHPLKVTLTLSRATKAEQEKVFAAIEDVARAHDGRVMQYREQNEDLKFYIGPSKMTKTKQSKTQHSDKDDSSDNDWTSEEQPANRPRPDSAKT